MLTLLVDYAGRLHPLVIHFPIALLLVGAVGEGLRVRCDSEFLGRFVAWLILLGAIGAVVAAATGWLFAYQVHRPPELQAFLFWHRWLGVTSIAVTGFAAGAARRWMLTTNSRLRRLRSGLIWATALLVAVTAHLGAALVWGADFFS